jgi:nitroimidazol reductase NimA-like FMN-containing flavoprotein (pyridoxamine 5'-phosphate oxidase superfamily)
MDDRYATEVLTESECWELLSRTVVGRLAVCLDGKAHIFPINYLPDRGSIVFRTAEGTKLSAARHHHVSFEIDGYEPERGIAWSVIVAGEATEIVDPDEWDDARDLPLFPWHVAPKGRFVRISADEISGRRFFAPYAGPSGFNRPAPR